METADQTQIAEDAQRVLGEIIDDKALCRDIVASLATAHIDNRKRIRISIPGGMRGMHRRTEALENVAQAIQSRKGYIRTHKRQARVCVPKAGESRFEIVLASGTPGDGGFHVNKKGQASQDLIGLRQEALLSFEDDSPTPQPVRNEGLFVIQQVRYEEVDGAQVEVEMIVHLAYPAYFNDKRTFIHCGGSDIIGRASLASAPKVAKPNPESEVKVSPTPRFRKKPGPAGA